MAGMCEGRICIVTGAGRGIGRAHALEFARQGAKVVVNDIGAELDGSGGSESPAAEVASDLRGSQAVPGGQQDLAASDGEGIGGAQPALQLLPLRGGQAANEERWFHVTLFGPLNTWTRPRFDLH